MNLLDLLTLAQITFYLPLVTLVVTFFLAVVLRRKNRIESFLNLITFLSSLSLLIVSILMMLVQEKTTQFTLFSGILELDFRLDALSVFMILLINIVAFASSWNSIAYLAATPSSPEKPWWQQGVGFHVLINLFHFTMLLVPMADNLIVVWIAIELTTVGSAILIVYEGRKSSWEATWKYLIITSSGIILALFGTIFLANSIHKDLINTVNSNELLNWKFLIDQKINLDPQFVWFAFLFALIGYGTKAGLAPLHTWLPDGHGEAPSPISALLSGVLLKASLYVILRFYTLTNVVLGKSHADWTSYALLIAGLLSLLMATPFILKENSFKRVLAYHSLEHMGIIVFGLGMGGAIAVSGAILHMLNHAITKALMFLAYGNILKRYEKEGMPVVGALHSMPWSGGLLTLGGLALVGTPPFNIFMSELIILWGALSRFLGGKAPDQPAYSSAVVGIAIAIFIISTTLIFYGLVNHLKKLVLGKPEKEILRERFTWPSIGPVALLFILMLLLGVWIIPPLANLVNESARIVLGL